MTRRTRCTQCARLGCAPARHCGVCSHLNIAHGTGGCEAQTIDGDGIRGCDCEGRGR